MFIHRPVGLADWSQTEVVGPYRQDAIEPRHYHFLIQQELIPPGQLANRFTDTLDTLRDGTVPRHARPVFGE